jgi:oligopeptide/dipeptide ABC transporter ATP-binding protein
MVLSVTNLSVRLPCGGESKPVVRRVSFDVAADEILGVVGESGCGKSITNLAIIGLLPNGAAVEADRLHLCGHDLLTLDKRQWTAIRGRKVAMVFQNPMSALNPSLTVGTQLLETLHQTRPHSRQTAEQAVELLDEVGIASPGARMHAYPHELSGGMAQRVMIAIAIACQPALLIADEPTTALDANTQTQILDLLTALCRQRKMAMMLVSHDIGVVQQYADRMQVMYAGEIVESGPVHTVTSNPAHPYTRGLLSSLPGRHGTAHKAPLPTIPGAVPPSSLIIDGCRFASRCAQAQSVCQDLAPPSRLVQGGSVAVRCHF